MKGYNDAGFKVHACAKCIRVQESHVLKNNKKQKNYDCNTYGLTKDQEAKYIRYRR